MKKGFTLIELLAVIMVLAIVALIATPIVSNSIDTARERVAKAEAEMILKGIADYCSGEDIKVRTGEIKKEDRICTNIDSVNVRKMVKDIKKETNISNAKYKDGKVTSLTIVNNGIIFVLDSQGNMVKS